MDKRKINKRRLSLIFAVVFIGFLSMGTLKFQQDEWVVPPPAKKMKNPTDPDDKDGLFTGKMLYSKNCKSCHGKSGRGDGPASNELKTFAGDFTSDDFQSQTDGEIFYKIREGRGDMPSFKKIIPEDENVWFLVNYIRTMD